VARVRRRELPDGYFHLTARSVAESHLFRDVSDRAMFVSLLTRAPSRFGVTLHAYCLMGTHYHAVVEGATERLSPAVQWFQGHYAREFNARHGRRGALFAERFSSWVVHDEDHLRATLAYIAANPVRAGLVDRPEHWPWTAIRPVSEHAFGVDEAAKLAGYGS
jgi:putative transposase